MDEDLTLYSYILGEIELQQTKDDLVFQQSLLNYFLIYTVAIKPDSSKSDLYLLLNSYLCLCLSLMFVSCNSHKI